MGHQKHQLGHLTRQQPQQHGRPPHHQQQNGLQHHHQQQHGRQHPPYGATDATNTNDSMTNRMKNCLKHQLGHLTRQQPQQHGRQLHQQQQHGLQHPPCGATDATNTNDSMTNRMKRCSKYQLGHLT